MLKHVVLPASTISLAMFVLIISLVNAAKIDIDVQEMGYSLPEGPLYSDRIHVAYTLPDASASPLPLFAKLEVVNDRFHIMTANNTKEKSRFLLDAANKRLVFGEKMLRKGRTEEGLVALRKSQEYLKNSYQVIENESSYETMSVLNEISIASLKHRERLENIIPLLPDETRTLVIENVERAKAIYNQTKIALSTNGYSAPTNPFDN